MAWLAEGEPGWLAFFALDRVFTVSKKAMSKCNNFNIRYWSWMELPRLLALCNSVRVYLLYFILTYYTFILTYYYTLYLGQPQGPDTVDTYNTIVSALGPDTVDTYRTSRVIRVAQTWTWLHVDG